MSSLPTRQGHPSHNQKREGTPLWALPLEVKR
jgi:hypothetical protein